MRHNFVLLSGIFIALTLSACAPSFVQVYRVDSPNCHSDNEYLYYENDTLRVVYMFWGENGTMGIFIHNRSDLPLYIDWKKCSFVVGEHKNDYWADATTMVSEGYSMSIGEAQQKGSASSSYWLQNFLPNTVSGNSLQSSTTHSNWRQQTFSSSAAMIVKPERITFIPPHATIGMAAYALMQTGIPIGKSATVTDTTVRLFENNRYHNVTIPIQTVGFNATNSPFRFRSYLTYSHDEQFGTEAHLDSYFYLSQLMQLPENAFTAGPVTEFAESSKNMWSSPSRFYVRVKSGGRN